MSDSRYSVYFAQSPSSTLTSAIVLVPTTDSWNDFGYRTFFTAHRLEKGSGDWEPIDLRLAFLEKDESPVEIVNERLKDKPNKLIKANDVGPFFTIFRDLDSYRGLVQRLGPEGAREFLFSINDLVNAQRLRPKPPWFGKATQMDVFRKSFMRNGETVFAFHNAAPILTGLRREQLDVMSEALTLRFKLSTFQNPHVLNVEFAPGSIIPGRIAVLIGKNGTGKSRSLHKLVKYALQDDRRLRGPDGERSQISRIIAIESPGETHATFPKENPRGKIEYRRISLHRSAKAAGRSQLASLFVQLGQSNGSIRDVSRWDLFAKAVSAMAPLHEVMVWLKPYQKLKREGVPIATEARWGSLSELMQGSEEAKLERWSRVDPGREPRRMVDNKAVPLSSGQITFLRFAAQASLHIENGTLVLLDEPETHLHPNLITEFVGLLNRLLELTGSLAIIATHSAYFVREVPRRQVLVFTAHEERIEISNPRLRTLGADVGAISFFVFGDDLQSKLLGRVLERLSDRKRRRRELPALEEELPAEAIMHLRRQWEKIE